MIRVIELSILTIYMLICIFIGYYLRKRAKTLVDFLIAGREVGTLTNAIAIFATISSAATYMGFAALGYKFGILLLLACCCGPTGFLLFQLLLAKPLRNYGMFTITDFLGDRYDSKIVRVIASIFTFIFLYIYIIPQLKALGILGSYLLGIDYTFVVIVLGSVYLIYVLLGGMWAITITDIIQGLLVAIMGTAMGITIYLHFGNLNALIYQASARYPALFAVPSNILPFFGLIIAGTMFVTSSAHIVNRIFTSRNIITARRSLCCVTWIYIPVIFGLILLPIGAHALLPPLKDPDWIFVEMAGKLWHPVLVGLGLAGLAAALMSTTDALLITCAAIVANDIYRKTLKPDAPEENVVRLARYSVLVIGVTAIIISLKPPGLIGEIVAMLLVGFASTFFFPILLGVWWRRANKYGAVAGMLAGFISFVLIRTFKLMPTNTEIFVSGTLNLLLIILVSYLTPPPSENALKLYFKLHS